MKFAHLVRLVSSKVFGMQSSRNPCPLRYVGKMIKKDKIVFVVCKECSNVHPSCNVKPVNMYM